MRRAILSACIGLAAMALAGQAQADRMNEPFGSRYLEYAQATKWSEHFGRLSARGWTREKYVRTVEDVNGDGMGDLVAFGEDGVYASLSNGSGFDPFYIAIATFSYQDNWRVGT